MYERVEQCLAESFFGVVNLFDALKSLEGRHGLVAKCKVSVGFIKLLEYRTAEFLAITELGVFLIGEHSYLRGMCALIGNNQCKIAI